MLLDNERYAEVIAYGKDAVTKMGENKIEKKALLLQNKVGTLFRSREQNGTKDTTMQKAFLNMQ